MFWPFLFIQLVLITNEVLDAATGDSCACDVFCQNTSTKNITFFIGKKT